MAESIFKRLPAPPAAETLGWELIREDPEAGTIEIAFHPGEALLNPHGSVQGGFVSAMLDDTMGPALVSKNDGACVPSTIDMHVSFIRAVKPGRVIGRGRVVSQGKSIAFLEAELFDTDGNLLARATSSARIVAFG
ncbi:MAG TPA: PaaI family thioesterase [Allosphingosinicella sp.]|nr:PaaI family thioesterase [Allosphingosinicella sp.]